MKRLLAEQFSDMEVLTSAFGGKDGSSLITDRNAAALSVLNLELQKGERSLAIFYGAAHMHELCGKAAPATRIALMSTSQSISFTSGSCLRRLVLRS